MTYKEISKELDELYRKDGFIFQTAFFHLMERGKSAFTEENIAETCAEIRAQDDSKSMMTNEFQCAIVETAGKLAKYNSAVLAVYFGKYFNNNVKQGDY